MTCGGEAEGGFDILHTRKSPSIVCVANMSDFCLDEDACHANVTMGEGALVVLRVWMMVKVGFKDTSRIEPFIYLSVVSCEPC